MATGFPRHLPPMIWLMTALLAATSCSSSSGTDATVDLPGESADVVDAIDPGPDVPADPGSEAIDVPSDTTPPPCTESSCGEHGVCADVAGVARCECEPGYDASEGGSCVNVRSVSCRPVEPADAGSAVVPVEITYTAATGWSQPAACAWTCHDGFLKVLDRCVRPGALDRWCRGSCGEKVPNCRLEAPPADFEACVAACLADLDGGDGVSAHVCQSVVQAFEVVPCTALDTCVPTADTGSCAALCDGAAACGMLDAGLPIGSSRGECLLNCQAMLTGMSGEASLGPITDCLEAAVTKCDGLEFLSCAATGFVGVCDFTCAGLPTTCAFGEGWPAEADCRQACDGWSGRQRLEVSRCLQDVQCSLSDSSVCLLPIASLPAGAADMARAFAALCPSLLPEVDLDSAVVSEFWGWTLVGMLNHVVDPSIINFPKVAECLSGLDTCTEGEGGPLVPCLLNSDPLVLATAACRNLVACWQASGTNPLRLDPLSNATCTERLKNMTDPAAFATCMMADSECAAMDACLSTAVP